MSRYVTARHAAQHLGVSRRHIYTLVSQGRLDALRIGRRNLRILRDSLERFESERLVDPDDAYELPPPPGR